MDDTLSDVQCGIQEYPLRQRGCLRWVEQESEGMTDINEFLGSPAEDSGLPYHVPVRREAELKPCPFCGSDDVYLVNASSDGNEWGVVCRDCDVWADNRLMDMTKEQAIELWNRRVKG